jgi:serine/threonine protein kinase
MKYLCHPNIVQLYDCVMAEDMMYLVMELVSGGEVESCFFFYVSFVFLADDCFFS